MKDMQNPPEIDSLFFVGLLIKAYYEADLGASNLCSVQPIPHFETVNLPLQIVQAHGAPPPAQDATLTGESQSPQAQKGHELRSVTDN